EAREQPRAKAQAQRLRIATPTILRPSVTCTDRVYQPPVTYAPSGCTLSCTTTTAVAPSFAPSSRRRCSISVIGGAGSTEASITISPSWSKGCFGSVRVISTVFGSVGWKCGAPTYCVVCESRLVQAAASQTSAARTSGCLMGSTLVKGPGRGYWTLVPR